MGKEKIKRPLLSDSYENIRITTQTGASTALNPRGVIALTSTSTAGPVVHTLAHAPKRGRQFSVSVLQVGATSSPHHINAGSGVGIGSSSEDMLALSTAGDGAHLIGLSTSRWGVVGSHGGVTTSTST